MNKRWAVLGGTIVLAAIVAALLSVRASSDRLVGAVSIDVAAVQLPLDPQNPARRNVGNVTYVGGWVLSSTAKSFGGFSGLIVDAQAQQLTAISDKGEWWRSRFDPRAVMPPTDAAMMAYSNEGSPSKKALDAESIIAQGEGVLISFEQKHRLEWVPRPGAPAIPSSFMAGVSFDGVSNNGGMEAITLLQDGHLLAFAERGLDSAGRLKAWLSIDDASEGLFYKPPTNFAPTDAATLPNGDVVVLLRQYSAIDGVAIKVHHIRRDDIRPGNVLVGTEILHITPKMSVDNMEGLDVVALDPNTVRLVMVSDDNFNPLQRTLLMMFDYKF